MKAYYYCIVNKKDNKIVLEGIIKDAEDTICPQQETDIEELPFECEAHHFKSENYNLLGFYFNIPREEINKYRI